LVVMNGMEMPSREWTPADRTGAAFRPEAAARDVRAEMVLRLGRETNPATTKRPSRDLT
jgi:hypothetical protein